MADRIRWAEEKRAKNELAEQINFLGQRWAEQTEAEIEEIRHLTEVLRIMTAHVSRLADVVAEAAGELAEAPVGEERFARIVENAEPEEES